VKSLLIVRLGAVGDGLMLAPALACLRRAHPSAHIDVAGVLWRLRLLAGPTLADAVRPIEDFFPDGRVSAGELNRYDRIIVFAIDLDAPIVRDISAAVPDRVEVHHSFPMSRTSEHHVIDHIQQALSGLGIEQTADRRYRLPVPEIARQYAEKFLAETAGNAPRVYIQPGTKITTKRWPAERFAALCRELVYAQSCQVFLGCGPLDEETVRPIEQNLAGVAFVPARGQDLVSTAGVLSQMDLCIGVDSGVTHLAALVGTPTIAIFGPTRQQLWGPVGPNVHVLAGSRGLECCTDDHPRVCEGGCMEEVSVERVLAAASKLMGDGRG
jgi:ADP-heptose:LPS heptosyltransferase